MKDINPNRTVEIEKLTLNIGAGKSQDRLEKGVKLLKMLTGIPPIKTITKKRLPAWNLRPGLPVGCKITLRDKGKIHELIATFLKAKDGVLGKNNFDEEGNVSFGIHEYIDIPTAKYDPEIGIMGFQICISLKRKGFRIKYRRQKQKKLPAKQRIRSEDSVKFMQDNFKIKLKEEE